MNGMGGSRARTNLVIHERSGSENSSSLERSKNVFLVRELESDSGDDDGTAEIANEYSTAAPKQMRGPQMTQRCIAIRDKVLEPH